MPSVEHTTRAELLRALCTVACRVLHARAASIALLEEPAGELVFVAAAGAGADEIDGARFKASEGLAGQALRTGERVALADVDHDPRFARDIAVATGYAPDALVVVPVCRGDGVAGVLSVLDAARDDEAAVDSLARQAAATLAFAEELGQTTAPDDREPGVDASPPLSDTVLPALFGEDRAGGIAAGGGATSALALALVADLLASVARASAAWEEGAAAAAQAGSLRRRAVALAGENAAAFATAMAVLRPAADAPGDAGRLRSALDAAADVPLRVAQLGADLSYLAGHVARHADPDARVDAQVAADIAAACARGAARLVEVNLAVTEGDDRLAAARVAVEMASREASGPAPGS